MNTPLYAIAKNIAEDAIALAQKILDKQGLDSGLLEDDSDYKIIISDNIIVNLLFNDYIMYVDKGRKPRSAMPPISAIRDWALKKGIATDNHILYAIAKAIARDGIAPRPILDVLITELEKNFENKWSINLFDFIVNQIQDLFTKNG